MVFGVLGYLFHKFNWPIIPFILCLVLGPKMEISFIQSLEISSGNLLIFCGKTDLTRFINKLNRYPYDFHLVYQKNKKKNDSRDR
ncbi:hypothetical protein [Caldifermentibacillus hisashii]|uniref:hypothetical protein n=1 Tax=Caldifermentibacillus hisashii TaxID=996558 RepID=UPI0031017B6F